MDFGAILLLIVLAAVAAFGYFYDAETVFGKPVIEMNLTRPELVAGEELGVNVGVSQAPVKSIEIRLGSEKRSVQCINVPCTLNVVFSPSPGVYNVEAVIEKTNGTREIRKRKLVVEGQQKMGCVNGIEFGSCSDDWPLYCNNGVLENNCAKCGCGLNHYCSDTSCVPEAIALEIDSVIYPEHVLSGKEFSVTVKTSAETEVQVGSQYEIILGAGGKEFTRKFMITSPSNVQEFTIGGIALEKPVNDLNLSVYAVNLERELVAAELIEDAISASDTIEKLGAPLLVSVFAEGDDVVLNWTRVSGATEYRVYKSGESNPLFVAYKFHSKYGGDTESAVIQALEPGTHYFTVTAAGPFNNESAYSEPKSITIN